MPVELLREFIVRVLVKKSVFQYDAQTTADRLLEADLRGISAHGVRSLPALLEAMDLGDVDPRGRVLIERETPAIAVLDGSRALGHVAATKGMQTAVAKAREVGTGTVCVHHSQHLGAAAVYALLAAQEGMIGCCTSASGGAIVTFPGSTQPALPNMPWAWALPAGDGPPLLIDLACGMIPPGQLELFAALGLTLPAESAWDAHGAPTLDPAAARRLVPAGGALGFGLGLVATLLASGLAGGKLPHQKTRSPSSDCAEHLFLAINVAQFTDAERFRVRVAEVRQTIQAHQSSLSSPPDAPPAGNAEAAEIEDRRLRGIPLAPGDVEQLTYCATRLKVELPWPAAR